MTSTDNSYLIRHDRQPSESFNKWTHLIKCHSGFGIEVIIDGSVTRLSGYEEEQENGVVYYTSWTPRLAMAKKAGPYPCHLEGWESVVKEEYRKVIQEAEELAEFLIQRALELRQELANLCE